MNISRMHVLAVSVIVALTTIAQGAPFSPPPSWSPMTMLNVTYDTTAHKLAMVEQSALMGTGTYAVLAIDTYLNPSVTSGSTSYGRPNNTATTFGSFDTTQPWGVLNNTAFSRQLGFNPGGSTLQADIQAAYGLGAGIWIECLSKSPGLDTYQAIGKWGVNAAGTIDALSIPIIDSAAPGYAGIFGTAGSSAKWQWDYQMDHNVYAVSSAYLTSLNQLFTANYKVYIGDAQGNEILNADNSSASTLETWTWQGPANVPEPMTLALLAGGALLMAGRRKT